MRVLRSFTTNVNAPQARASCDAGLDEMEGRPSDPEDPQSEGEDEGASERDFLRPAAAVAEEADPETGAGTAMAARAPRGGRPVESPPTLPPRSPGAETPPPSPGLPFGCCEEGECAICLGPLANATPFPHDDCPHIYCAGCLEKLRAHDPAAAILCPQCRRRGPTPPRQRPPPPPPRLPPGPLSRRKKLQILTICALGIGLLVFVILVDITAVDFGCGKRGDSDSPNGAGCWVQNDGDSAG